MKKAFLIIISVVFFLLSFQPMVEAKTSYPLLGLEQTQALIFSHLVYSNVPNKNIKIKDLNLENSPTYNEFRNNLRKSSKFKGKSNKEISNILLTKYKLSEFRVVEMRLNTDGMKESGLFVRKFTNGKVSFIAYRGSDGLRKDWLGDDVDVVLGNMTKYTVSVWEIIKKAAKIGKGTRKSKIYAAAVNLQINDTSRKDGIRTVLTGHSLGGYIAQVMGGITNKNTYTFNSPGLNPPSYDRLSAFMKHFNLNGALVFNYVISNDGIQVQGKRIGVNFKYPIQKNDAHSISQFYQFIRN